LRNPWGPMHQECARAKIGVKLQAGMEDDKRQDRNLAKAEAVRRLARIKLGVIP
jgi:hypothetical protein